MKVAAVANGSILRWIFSVHACMHVLYMICVFLIFFILFDRTLSNENYTICEITHFSTWKEMSIVLMIIQICVHVCVVCIYGNNVFNGIQWQSDRCAMCGFFPLLKIKIITAIIYGQFSFSALFCSIPFYFIPFSSLSLQFFFAIPNKKIVWSRMSSHAIWSMSLFKWPQYTYIYVCMCSFFIYEIGGTWLFRLLSSHRYMLWISFFTTLDGGSSNNNNSDNTMCLFMCICISVHYIDKDQSAWCDKLERRIWESLVAFIHFHM